MEDNDNKTVVHSNCTKDVCIHVATSDIQTPKGHDIFDSGTTGYFLLLDALMSNKQPTTDHLCITLPDVYTISSMHTCLLDIPQLPLKA